MYGNIGSDTRLDFTVIGPAVNLTARIESMCRQLGRQLLLSADFVAAGRIAAQSLGALRIEGRRRRSGDLCADAVVLIYLASLTQRPAAAGAGRTWARALRSASHAWNCLNSVSRSVSVLIVAAADGVCFRNSSKRVRATASTLCDFSQFSA